MLVKTQSQARMIERVRVLRLAEKIRKKERRGSKTKFSAKFSRQRNLKIGRRFEWNDISVPEHLTFNQKKRDECCRFFIAIEYSVSHGKNVRLIFNDTKHIALDALTFLLAKIQKLRWIYGENSVTGTYPSSRRVERVLTESGFFKILGVRSRRTYTKGAIRYVKYRSDVKLLGSHIEALKIDLLGDDIQLYKPIALKIVRAIKEAMSNVSHHAYQTKSIRTKKMLGRWWLNGHLNVSKNELSLSFYDCGVGIPKTLVRKYGMEQIRGVFSLLPIVNPDDAQMIEAAVELGRTGTLKSYRGKGLQDMHQLIKLVGEGSLTIHSRRGSYHYNYPNAKSKNFEEFLEGTLITWVLPLNKAAEIADSLIEVDGVDDE